MNEISQNTCSIINPTFDPYVLFIPIKHQKLYWLNIAREINPLLILEAIANLLK